MGRVLTELTGVDQRVLDVADAELASLFELVEVPRTNFELKQLKGEGGRDVWEEREEDVGVSWLVSILIVASESRRLSGRVCMSRDCRLEEYVEKTTIYTLEESMAVECGSAQRNPPGNS